MIPRLAQHPTDHPLQNAHVRELTADRPRRARCAGAAARAATLHLHLHLHATPCHDALHALATEQFIYILDASMVIQFHLYRISRELSAQVFGFPFGSLHLASRWMQPCHSAASSSITAASQQHHSLERESSATCLGNVITIRHSRLRRVGIWLTVWLVSRPSSPARALAPSTCTS